MSRDVYSSVSWLTDSCAGGASSSSASGGSVESGMSVNSGRCFSFTTRSDFGTCATGGTTTTGSRSTSTSRSCSTICSRSAVACSPMRRSTAASRRRRTEATSASRPAPMRSITRSHEMPKNSERPTASSASSSSVAPLKPSARARALADRVAERPAGRERQRHGELPEPDRLERGAREQHEPEAERRRAAADGRTPRRAGRCGGIPRRPAPRRRSPTTTRTGRTGRAADRRATRRPARRRFSAGLPVPENDQPGSSFE